MSILSLLLTLLWQADSFSTGFLEFVELAMSI